MLAFMSRPRQCAIRLALKYGFRVIYHCDYATHDTIDLLEAVKDKIFLGRQLA